MQSAKLNLEQADEINVLLIEDVLGDAKAITRALLSGDTMYSFQIERRPSLAEGLDFLAQHPVDAVLLDLGLPDAKALTALIKIHESFPHMPIVIISGVSDITKVRLALQQGAQEFLIKGECSGATIRQSIYQAIARKKIELSYERGDKL